MDIKIINSIINSKRGCWLREFYIKNNYPDIYDEVNKFILLHNIDYSVDGGSNNPKEEFKIKFWYYVNNITKTITCEKCNKKTSFKRNFKDGFRIRCQEHAQKEESKIKRKKTTIEKYGVDNIAKSDKIKDKAAKTCMERYVDKYGNPAISSGSDPIIQEKSKKTVMEKYGVEYYYQSNEFKNNNKKIMNEKYGVDCYLATKECQDLSKMSLYNKARDKYIKYGLNFISTNQENFKIKFKSLSCNHIFDITYEMLNRRVRLDKTICIICNPIDENRSEAEKELSQFIKNLDLNVVDTYKELGIEIDIYLQDYKFGIEYNGLFYHSEFKKNDHNRHLNKTIVCEKNDIELLHIWEDDYEYKNKIVESIILKKLGKIFNRISHKDCEIKIVNDSDKFNFLNNNILKVSKKTSINVGLYYNNEIVSLMAFKKEKSMYKNYKLCDFADRIDVVVYGSAQKLFNYFIENFEFNEIVGNADISNLEGNFYKNLGFNFINRTLPEYYFIVNDRRFKKNFLMYNEKLPENKIAEKYHKIYNCGMDKYVYTNPNKTTSIADI